MYILSIARDLKVKKQKNCLKVFFMKNDITEIVAKVFGISTTDFDGGKAILNSSGMGFTMKQYLETKIKLDENDLVQPICEYLKSLEENPKL